MPGASNKARQPKRDHRRPHQKGLERLEQALANLHELEAATALHRLTNQIVAGMISTQGEVFRAIRKHTKMLKKTAAAGCTPAAVGGGGSSSSSVEAATLPQLQRVLRMGEAGWLCYLNDLFQDLVGLLELARREMLPGTPAAGSPELLAGGSTALQGIQRLMSEHALLTGCALLHDPAPLFAAVAVNTSASVQQEESTGLQMHFSLAAERVPLTRQQRQHLMIIQQQQKRLISVAAAAGAEATTSSAQVGFQTEAVLSQPSRSTASPAGSGSSSLVSGRHSSGNGSCCGEEAARTSSAGCDELAAPTCDPLQALNRYEACCLMAALAPACQTLQTLTPLQQAMAYVACWPHHSIGLAAFVEASLSLEAEPPQGRFERRVQQAAEQHMQQRCEQLQQLELLVWWQAQQEAEQAQQMQPVSGDGSTASQLLL